VQASVGSRKIPLRPCAAFDLRECLPAGQLIPYNDVTNCIERNVTRAPLVYMEVIGRQKHKAERREVNRG
jgi:hypothetical protein